MGIWVASAAHFLKREQMSDTLKTQDWILWNFHSIGGDVLSDHYAMEDKANYLKIVEERGWQSSIFVKISDDTFFALEEIEEYTEYNFSEIDNWCKENCHGKWDHANMLWYEFELENDATAFKLRWA